MVDGRAACVRGGGMGYRGWRQRVSAYLKHQSSASLLPAGQCAAEQAEREQFHPCLLHGQCRGGNAVSCARGNVVVWESKGGVERVPLPGICCTGEQSRAASREGKPHGSKGKNEDVLWGGGAGGRKEGGRREATFEGSFRRRKEQGHVIEWSGT